MKRYFGAHTVDGEWHALLPRYLLLEQRVKGKRVLDIGCGTGIGASLLLEMGAAGVDGVDYRPEVVQLAQTKHDKQGLNFHMMFWEELDFSDDTFDLVVCLDPSAPITDPSLLAEVRRVLRDEGEYVCALERSTVEGLESVLPRYGYASVADQVDIGHTTERVPQIGELSNSFEHIANIVQRPLLGYLFEPPPSEGGELVDEPDQSRRLPDDGRGGVRRDAPDADDSGAWLPVDRHLSDTDEDRAAVEIFFCSAEGVEAPPLREIRLPYYGVVERLDSMLNDLQIRQSAGGEVSTFEEVLDDPSQAVDDEHVPTREFRADAHWDDTPTGVRERPAPPASNPSEFTHPSELYDNVRGDVDELLRQTEAAISERDEYIDHLVQKIHEWEQRFGETAEADEPTDFDRTPTGVFHVDDLQSATQTEPRLDELSEIDEDDLELPEAIERRIATLKDERERMRSQLQEREERLANLRDEMQRGEQAATLAEEPAEQDDDEASDAAGSGTDESSTAETD